MKRWAANDEAWLLNNRDKYSHADLAKRLKRTVISVQSKIQSLKSLNYAQSGKPLSKSERQWFEAHLDMPNAETCRILARGPKEIDSMRYDIKKELLSKPVKKKKIDKSQGKPFEVSKTIKLKPVDNKLPNLPKNLLKEAMTMGYNTPAKRETVKKLLFDKYPQLVDRMTLVGDMTVDQLVRSFETKHFNETIRAIKRLCPAKHTSAARIITGLNRDFKKTKVSEIHPLGERATVFNAKSFAMTRASRYLVNYILKTY